MSASRHFNLLPGFGEPLNSDFHGCALPSALKGGALYVLDPHDGVHALIMDHRLKLTTLCELTMLQIMNLITDKPDWHVKVHDENIVKKWRDEATASGRNITPNMLDWCVAELRYLATQVPQDASMAPPIVVYNGDVVKSDVAVSRELHDALNEAVNKFEEGIPDWQRDWHPGSEEKVWDLVHPSLFPLVYGVSRVLETGQTTLENCISLCGQGRITAEPTLFRTLYRDNLDKAYSKKFQWLPCEVNITGQDAK